MIAELIALKILILLFSVIVHEVMHGVAALYFGDRTAERAGRLTLNPIPHIDPIGTLLVPALLWISSGGTMVFGWAKPVPVNPLHFSNLRLGELATSAAGIISNLILAIIGAIVFHLAINIYPSQILIAISLFLVEINLLLAVFNLIPIPPLDGSKILMSQLSFRAARSFEQIEPYGFFLILALGMIPFGNSTILSTILAFGTGILKMLLGVTTL
jgi:Zn-dependent protease